MKVQMIKSNRERLITFLILFSFIVFSNTLFAQKQIIWHGATVSIETKDSWIFKGELLKVKQDSLRIIIPDSVNIHSIDIGNIKTIRIERSATPGILIGIAAGSLCGSSAGSRIYERSFGSGIITRAVGTWVGILGGGIIGGAVGALTGIDKSIRIEGKCPKKIASSLKYLKSKERKQVLVNNK